MMLIALLTYRSLLYKIKDSSHLYLVFVVLCRMPCSLVFGTTDIMI
jgi:hypothetical protein